MKELREKMRSVQNLANQKRAADAVEMAGMTTEQQARAKRVKTLEAAKRLMNLMNVAALADERAKELYEAAGEADVEADKVREPIADRSDKLARHRRAKILQNAQILNLQAAQARVKADGLQSMVQKL